MPPFSSLLTIVFSVCCSRVIEKIVLQRPPRLSEERSAPRPSEETSAPRPRRKSISASVSRSVSAGLRRTPSYQVEPVPADNPRGAKCICDIVRMMFVCDSLSHMATLLDLITKSEKIKVLRFKDRIAEPAGGWRDAMINFTLPNCSDPDHICEVQIVHKKMAMCRRKDGLGGHDDYVLERSAREILEFLGEEASDGSPSGFSRVVNQVRLSKCEVPGEPVEESVNTFPNAAGATVEDLTQ